MAFTKVPTTCRHCGDSMTGYADKGGNIMRVCKTCRWNKRLRTLSKPVTKSHARIKAVSKYRIKWEDLNEDITNAVRELTNVENRIFVMKNGKQPEYMI